MQECNLSILVLSFRFQFQQPPQCGIEVKTKRDWPSVCRHGSVTSTHIHQPYTRSVSEGRGLDFFRCCPCGREKTILRKRGRFRYTNEPPWGVFASLIVWTMWLCMDREWEVHTRCTTAHAARFGLCRCSSVGTVAVAIAAGTIEQRVFVSVHRVHWYTCQTKPTRDTFS